VTAARIADVLAGACAAGFFVVAMFFGRFWSQSRERLFAYFAGAFAILGIQRILVSAMSDDGEHGALLYGIRLVAFLLILVGIWDRNRRPG
jgi:hypothetical protein